MTKATGSSELVERLREGVQALYHEPGQSTPIYAIVPANQTMREAADRITDLEARLARADASAPRPDNALADELASELYKEHASFLRDKDARDWDELPEAIKAGWMNEAHKRLEPVLRYISLAALRSTPPEAKNERQCAVCQAVVAQTTEMMCCHCTEMPWRALKGADHA